MFCANDSTPRFGASVRALHFLRRTTKTATTTATRAV
jgi:hypothetical protein